MSYVGKNWEIFPLIAGFVLAYIVYHYKQYRMGGVIVVPLLAVYTIKFPIIALVVVLCSIPTFLILEFLMEHYAIYGRRLLYVSLTISIFVVGISEILLNYNDWFALLLPGLMAYNYHRESHSDVRVVKSIIVTLFVYLFCIIYAWFFSLIV